MTEKTGLYYSILDHTASREQQERFEELMRNPEEKAAFARYERIWLGSCSVKDYRKYDGKKAFIRVTRKLSDKRIHFRLIVRSVAAGIAAGLIIVFTVFNMYRSRSKNSYVYFETQTGNKSLLVLPDNSKVWLNSCTSIKYAGDFNRKQRDVYISGECYFEVVHGKKPFVVHVNDLNIAVHGTHFNVSAYPDDEKIETTLETGSIGISNGSGEEYLVKPGQMVEFDKQSTRFFFHAVPVAEYSAWRKNKLYLHDEALAELAGKLERQYGINVRFEPESLGEHVHYTGVFGNENLIEILQAISVASGVKVRKENSEYIISR